MNTGVEILLKRMETNPDDFNYQAQYASPSRWMRLIDHALGDELLTQEEHDAIKAGLLKLRRDRFTELVMKELAGVEDEASDEGKSYSAPKTGISSGGVTLTSSTTQSPYSNTTGKVTIPSGTITLGNTSLNEEQLKHMKAHLEYLSKPKVEVNKKPLLKRIFK